MDILLAPPSFSLHENRISSLSGWSGGRMDPKLPHLSNSEWMEREKVASILVYSRRVPPEQIQWGQGL